ncbi:hypothetical protein [Weissella cibaria]|uniref:hypothetical protein n=1 Tax=Weissella cibaria TaxID=137591 RepID=UPI0018A012B3|nr:hypothetical protein [Weissella cibaria]
MSVSGTLVFGRSSYFSTTYNGGDIYLSKIGPLVVLTYSNPAVTVATAADGYVIPDSIMPDGYKFSQAGTYYGTISNVTTQKTGSVITNSSGLRLRDTGIAKGNSFGIELIYLVN